ncbi:hypothetical protein VARIO8X_50291 [Burkholderiales bacterium 8X]|nr:hypothetical protein VARIO8X_50291 [Burkholderiales bacterium 8X]
MPRISDTATASRMRLACWAATETPPPSNPTRSPGALDERQSRSQGLHRHRPAGPSAGQRPRSCHPQADDRSVRRDLRTRGHPGGDPHRRRQCLLLRRRPQGSPRRRQGRRLPLAQPADARNRQRDPRMRQARDRGCQRRCAGGRARSDVRLRHLRCVRAGHLRDAGDQRRPRGRRVDAADAGRAIVHPPHVLHRHAGAGRRALSPRRARRGGAGGPADADRDADRRGHRFEESDRDGVRQERGEHDGPAAAARRLPLRAELHHGPVEDGGREGGAQRLPREAQARLQGPLKHEHAGSRQGAGRGFFAAVDRDLRCVGRCHQDRRKAAAIPPEVRLPGRDLPDQPQGGHGAVVAGIRNPARATGNPRAGLVGGAAPRRAGGAARLRRARRACSRRAVVRLLRDGRGGREAAGADGPAGAR